MGSSCKEKWTPDGTTIRQSNDNELDESIDSLLFLPNECLREIFDRMDVLSLCQLADVCQRFRSLAENAFRKRFTEIEYKDVRYKRSLFRRVLCKFGYLIHSIDDGCCIIRFNEEIDVYAIAVYCTNLRELVVRGATFDCRVSKRLFSNLKTLKLVLCEFIGDTNVLFSKCRKLEVLTIHHATQSGFLERHFPKLVDLNFDTSYAGSETILKMLSLNPQLNRLIIPIGMDDFHISAVVENTKNVKILRFFNGLMTTQITPNFSEQGFLQLSKLKQLTALAFETNVEIYQNSIGRLMNSFAENNVNIEIVYLRYFSISHEDLRCFIDLKTITILHLHEVQPCSDDDLISLVKGLPSLKSIGLFFENTIHNPVSTDGLINLVKFGTQLQLIYLNGVQKFQIDQTLVDILVDTFKRNWTMKRVKLLFIRITACKCNSKHDIPLDIQLKYIKEHKFSLTFSDKKCINCY